MKKLTVRLNDYIYDRLYLVANDNNISVNKIVSSILEKYINEPREINYLKELDDKLFAINNKLESEKKEDEKN